MKYNWRIKEKEYYFPSKEPELIHIPRFKYLCIKGIGNPNNEDFSNRVSILYGLSYTIKMLPKKGFIPNGYFDYTVYPLEGLWSLRKTDEIFNKDQLIYTIMIKQPDFVNEDVFNKALEILKSRKQNHLLEEVYLDEIEDGLSLQILHIGSYDSETESFNKLKSFAKENNLKIQNSYHREIYLTSKKRKQLKTVLRYCIGEIKDE